MVKPHCPYCEQKPHEIDEYIDMAKQNNMTPEEFVRTEEGTYSHMHNVFTCTRCYIKIGMPLTKDLFHAYGKYREMYPQ